MNGPRIRRPRPPSAASPTRSRWPARRPSFTPTVAGRTTLALDGNGDDLITAVAAASPNTVVVPETGTATTMPWLAGVKGVVEAWYPGDRQGTALARLLYGDTDFTGRLPMAFPRSLADTPTDTPARYRGTFADGSTTRPAGSTAIRQVSYSEGLEVGYKFTTRKGSSRSSRSASVSPTPLSSIRPCGSLRICAAHGER